MRDASDSALVLHARNGDAEAFGELVQRYQATVYAVSYRMLGERRAAEDLTQEAFLRAYQRLDTFDETRPFGPWMRRVATNLCLNHLERTGPAMLPLDDELDQAAWAQAELASDPAAVQDQRDSQASLQAAIQALPPRYRAVVELRHFQDLSYAEMAAALKRPLSDVKSDLFRARRLLARLLRPDG
jgi:RNA polymerase sigma-70 factor (ECF subfamily)